MTNKYLVKLARLGEVSKGLIRNKLAPAFAKFSPGKASQLEAISRSAQGSKIAPRVFSTPEYAQHSVAMANLGKKLMPGMRAPEANRLVAVAARARRMGVIGPAK
jgi:hypothetical protein